MIEITERKLIGIGAILGALIGYLIAVLAVREEHRSLTFALIVVGSIVITVVIDLLIGWVYRRAYIKHGECKGEEWKSALDLGLYPAMAAAVGLTLGVCVAVWGWVTAVDFALQFYAVAVVMGLASIVGGLNILRLARLEDE